LKCDGTRAETRFRLSAKRKSPFKSAGASVQSATGSRGVRISGSNAGCTIFRGSVKSTGYPVHSPVFPSLPLPCFAVCHRISNGIYNRLPGDELSGSKHVENIKIEDENMNLENVRSICLCYVMWLQSCAFIMIGHSSTAYYVAGIFAREFIPFQPKLILVLTTVTDTCRRAYKACKNWPLCSYVG